MSDFERVYLVDKMLRRKSAPSMKDLREKLEVSRATVTRTLSFMRDRLGAPIHYDADSGGYTYSNDAFELPGLWFTAPELEALLLVQTLLKQLQPGLVKDKLRPMEKRLKELLGVGPFAAQPFEDRIRILATPFRPVDSAQFEPVSAATVERKRLRLRYFTRSRGRESTREVSPQRMVYYRGNWYLDAWCHRSKELRRFALDAIITAEILSEAAVDVETDSGTDTEGYGIFLGQAEKIAVLRFAPEAARWVRKEVWHPRQRATTEPGGSLLLEVPYSHPRELLMDILRHGALVEVLKPAGLREAVAKAHVEAAEVYACRRPAGRSAGTAQKMSVSS